LSVEEEAVVIAFRRHTLLQVERMNRTIEDATVKHYFYETHDQLRTHLRDFVGAYNFAGGSDPQRPHPI
jgi:hypothetical protein